MPLLPFYRNESPDHAGRHLADIWKFDDEQLEYQHDFIQWLFPLEVPSPVNPLAPTLTPADIDAFLTDPRLQHNLLHSLDRMLTFYGLERTGTPDAPAITPLPTFNQRAHWLSPNDHNHLRLTRILHCLTLCGQRPTAQALLTTLLHLATTHPNTVTPRTLTFWQSAV